MDNMYGSIAIELIIGFVALFILTKALGKTQFSQITPFDFISALVIGELLGGAVHDPDISIFHVIYSVSIWGVLIYCFELITQRNLKSRKLLEGEPNVVIHKGMIKYEALKKAEIDINQLQSLLRQQGYFSIQEVEFAIVETNGMISVKAKPAFEQPKMNDLNLPLEQVNLPITLIIDGELIEENLKELGKSRHWLHEQLKNQGFKSHKEILFAEWSNENSPIFTMQYEKQTS